MVPKVVEEQEAHQHIALTATRGNTGDRTTDPLREEEQNETMIKDSDDKDASTVIVVDQGADQQQEEEEPTSVTVVGVEQPPLPAPVDIEEQQQPSLPTDVDEDDDEMTILWKTSPYAVGKVKPKWSDEFAQHAEEDGEQQQRPRPCCSPQSVISRLASLCCDWTERVGNMSVIYKRTPEKGDGPPQIVIVAGPFWFVTLFITIPLIVGISLVIYFRYIRCYNKFYLELIWGILLAMLLTCLLTASLSNPGILLRHTQPPPAAADEEGTNEEWIWNDQALTYRPPKAKYDPICAVVVEGFDHVCPWVGTAIGANNMKWFKRFLFMIAVCLCYQLILLYLAPCFP